MDHLQEIYQRIPQRPPFLFVDKIIEQNNHKIICQKQLTGEEDFFKGHFPGNPIMPGVLQQEAIFQSGALLMSFIEPQNENSKVGVVTRVDGVKFKQFIRPGDVMIMEVELSERLANIFKMKGKISVAGKLTTVLDFTGALVDRSSFIQ